MDKLARYFKALSEEVRLRIVMLLTHGELCVCDIMEVLEEPQSKVSRHLSYLKNSGIINAKRVGVWIHYALNERRHFCRRHAIGNVNERPLKDLWMDPDYMAFRERVQLFDFSPCTTCGGCDLSEDNEADCSGNAFPTCGMCPWAQGVVQCP